MKRTVSSVLLWLVVIFPFAFSAFAGNVPVSLFVNGEKQPTALLPRMIDSEIYVQSAVLKDALGLQTQWNATEGKLTITANGNTVVMAKDVQHAVVNGETRELGRGLVVVNQEAYVPIRLIGSDIGVKSIWDPLTESVSLYKMKQGSAPAQDIFDQAETVLPPLGNEADGTLAFIETGEGSVSIVSPGTREAKHFYLPDPTGATADRIVIDLPNIRLSAQGDWAGPSGEKLVSHGQVSKIRYSQFSDDPSTVRVVLELKEPTEYSVRTDVLQGLTTVRFGAAQAVQKHKVVIDAGHGGKDPGATGFGGRYEKHFTLELSQKVYRLLENHPTIEPHLTRNDDRFIELEDRARIANELDADLFVSIHGNTFEDSSEVSGTETYYWADDSIEIATLLHEQTLLATGFKDREVRKNRYRVLVATEMPAVLMEIGYLTNEANERAMLDSAAQQRIAEGIVKALEHYFK